MSLKFHLQANKGINAKPYALCAARPIGNGKVVKNSRQSYRNIPLNHIISGREAFTAVPSEDRCQHCCYILAIKLKNA